MTRLRQMMLEELERRNYSQNTRRIYLYAVTEFARHFHRSPDQLGLDHIRAYQAHLFRERKLKANSVCVYVEALRFLFVHVLKHRWTVADLPYPKRPQTLPLVLSHQEVAQLARDPRLLGAEIGFFSVLHTWNQQLEHHPHVHGVVPEGGLSPDGSRWVRPRYHFFLPVKALAKLFRGKFLDALRQAFAAGKLRFPGQLKNVSTPQTFAALLRQGCRHPWVVYAKRPWGGPEHVLQYLGNYTHRIAISNHRLIAMTDERVSFRWRDSAHGNKKRLMALRIEEFLRRFFLHVLSPGFVRIRHCGFLANRQRQHRLAICRNLLNALPPTLTNRSTEAPSSAEFWTCPRCGGTMVILEHVTATQMYVRPPPHREAA